MNPKRINYQFFGDKSFSLQRLADIWGKKDTYLEAMASCWEDVKFDFSSKKNNILLKSEAF